MVWGSMGDLVPVLVMNRNMKKLNVKTGLVCFKNYTKSVLKQFDDVY